MTESPRTQEQQEEEVIFLDKELKRKDIATEDYENSDLNEVVEEVKHNSHKPVMTHSEAIHLHDVNELAFLLKHNLVNENRQEHAQTEREESRSHQIHHSDYILVKLKFKRHHLDS